MYSQLPFCAASPCTRPRRHKISKTKADAGTNQAPSATAKADSADPQSEEIEILRRLLDRASAVKKHKFMGP